MPDDLTPDDLTPDYDADARALARLLRRSGYSYDQSKRLFRLARQRVGLTPPKRRRGAVERLTVEEQDAFIEAAYAESGTRGLMLRTLLETALRVKAFVTLRAEAISFAERSIRVVGKGQKARDIPILVGLARELRLHLGARRTGYVFPSPRGGHYSTRRVQQIVKAVARQAGLTKRVYPHLLRHTMIQRLADAGMPEALVQQFAGHARPETTQRYYRVRRAQVDAAFREALK